MLTATEAAQALGVSKRHLYQLASAKKIACYRFGSAVRFDPQDIEAYKAQCRSPATTAGLPVRLMDGLGANLKGKKMSEKQTEALRLAGEYRKTMPSDVLHLWADDVVGELRRLHVALLEAEAGLIMAGADVEPASDFVPSPTAALRIVRAALLPSNVAGNRLAEGKSG